MKKIIVSTSMLLAAGALWLRAVIPNPASVTFIWDNPNQAGLVYRIYGTNNPSAPTPWPLVATITAPSVLPGGTNLAYSITMTPGAMAFYMTASNFWGESPFSGVASTPPVPPQLNNLRLTSP